MLGNGDVLLLKTIQYHIHKNKLAKVSHRALYVTNERLLPIKCVP